MVGAGPADSFRVKKKGDVVLSRDGWQIRVNLLSEQQADVRENRLMVCCFFFFLCRLHLKKKSSQ